MQGMQGSPGPLAERPPEEGWQLYSIAAPEQAHQVLKTALQQDKKYVKLRFYEGVTLVARKQPGVFQSLAKLLSRPGNVWLEGGTLDLTGINHMIVASARTTLWVDNTVFCCKEEGVGQQAMPMRDAMSLLAVNGKAFFTEAQFTGVGCECAKTGGLNLAGPDAAVVLTRCTLTRLKVCLAVHEGASCTLQDCDLETIPQPCGVQVMGSGTKLSINGGRLRTPKPLSPVQLHRRAGARPAQNATLLIVVDGAVASLVNVELTEPSKEEAAAMAAAAAAAAAGAGTGGTSSPTGPLSPGTSAGSSSAPPSSAGASSGSTSSAPPGSSSGAGSGGGARSARQGSAGGSSSGGASRKRTPPLYPGDVSLNLVFVMGARLLARGCRLVAGESQAMSTAAGARITLADSHIEGWQGGITTRTSMLIAKACTFVRCYGHGGAALGPGSTGRLDGCTFEDCGSCGVAVPTAPETGAVDLVLQECAFRGCSKYGLASHNPEARVKMQRCVVQGSDHACALVHAGSSLEVEGGEMRSSTRGGFCLASYGSTLVARDVFLGAGVGTACIGLHEGAELQAQGCTLLAATSCLAPGGSAGSGAVGGGPAGAGSSSGSGDGSGGGIGLCVNGSMHGKPMKAVMSQCEIGQQQYAVTVQGLATVQLAGCSLTHNLHTLFLRAEVGGRPPGGSPPLALENCHCPNLTAYAVSPDGLSVVKEAVALEKGYVRIEGGASRAEEALGGRKPWTSLVPAKSSSSGASKADAAKAAGGSSSSGGGGGSSGGATSSTSASKGDAAAGAVLDALLGLGVQGGGDGLPCLATGLGLGSKGLWVDIPQGEDAESEGGIESSTYVVEQGALKTDPTAQWLQSFAAYADSSGMGGVHLSFGADPVTGEAPTAIITPGSAPGEVVLISDRAQAGPSRAHKYPEYLPLLPGEVLICPLNEDSKEKPVKKKVPPPSIPRVPLPADLAEALLGNSTPLLGEGGRGATEEGRKFLDERMRQLCEAVSAFRGTKGSAGSSNASCGDSAGSSGGATAGGAKKRRAPVAAAGAAGASSTPSTSTFMQKVGIGPGGTVMATLTLEFEDPLGSAPGPSSAGAGARSSAAGGAKSSAASGSKGGGGASRSSSSGAKAEGEEGSKGEKKKRGREEVNEPPNREALGVVANPPPPSSFAKFSTVSLEPMKGSKGAAAAAPEGAAAPAGSLQQQGPQATGTPPGTVKVIDLTVLEASPSCSATTVASSAPRTEAEAGSVVARIQLPAVGVQGEKVKGQHGTAGAAAATCAADGGHISSNISKGSEKESSQAQGEGSQGSGQEPGPQEGAQGEGAGCSAGATAAATKGAEQAGAARAQAVEALRAVSHAALVAAQLASRTADKLAGGSGASASTGAGTGMQADLQVAGGSGPGAGAGSDADADALAAVAASAASDLVTAMAALKMAASHTELSLRAVEVAAQALKEAGLVTDQQLVQGLMPVPLPGSAGLPPSSSMPSGRQQAGSGSGSQQAGSSSTSDVSSSTGANCSSVSGALEQAGKRQTGAREASAGQQVSLTDQAQAQGAPSAAGASSPVPSSSTAEAGPGASEGSPTAAPAAAAAQPAIPRKCAGCGAEEQPGGQAVKTCRGCLCTRYCGPECAASHWPVHKLVCASLGSARLAYRAVSAVTAAEGATAGASATATAAAAPAATGTSAASSAGAPPAPAVAGAAARATPAAAPAPAAGQGQKAPAAAATAATPRSRPGSGPRKRSK